MKIMRNRRSVRLKGYNYAQAGAYFVTICTQNRECFFGDIVDGEMRLNPAGGIVRTEWLNTTNLRKNVTLDAFVVMPNHIHGIVIIFDDVCRGVLRYAPTAMPPTQINENNGNTLRSPSQSIGAIIRGYKSTTTKQINIVRESPCIPVWQRNYYEHIIRDNDELNRIREYIRNNPLTWKRDRENDDLYDLTPEEIAIVEGKG